MQPRQLVPLAAVAQPTQWPLAGISQRCGGLQRRRAAHPAFMRVPGHLMIRPPTLQSALVAAAAADDLQSAGSAQQPPTRLQPQRYEEQSSGQAVGAPESGKSKALPPAEARRKAFESTPAENFRVVGVSFDGRQEELAAVQKGDAVMLVREPHNAYDPNAVSVQTLHGHGLGYIPRDQTGRLPQPVTFGRVNSIGSHEESGNLGLVIAVRPLLPALTVDALPAALERHVALSKALPADDWDSLRKAAYRRSGRRCEISRGVGPEWPVEATGVWDVDDHTKTVRLLGVAALAPEVNAAKSLSRLTLSSDRGQAAVDTLRKINGWESEEAHTYLHHVDDLLAIRLGDRWRLDLGWLAEQGVAVPPSLAALCR